MGGWKTKGYALCILVLIYVIVGITPLPLPSVTKVSAKPTVPYTLGGWTSVSKPVLPIKINQSQIPVGKNWTYTYPLEAGSAYRVYCYGDWIDDSTDLNKTDYDIFVYDPSGDLESYHTEAAGLPEHLGTTVDHPFFIPEQSGNYSFLLKNDPRESNGSEAATFMIIEHLETDRWYQRSMEGKVKDKTVEKTAGAYEFNTTSKQIDVLIEVPDTLDMYEARLYTMSNPATEVGTILNGLPLAWEPGLYGETKEFYGGYNVDSNGFRHSEAIASCEYPGEDMHISFKAKAEGNLLYHIVFIAEKGEGDINFIIKTDFDAPKLTLLNQPEKVSPGNSTKISVHIDEKFNLETLTLNYTTDNWATSTPTEIAATQNKVYAGTIPGQQAGTTIKYKVLARDISRNSATVSGSYMVKNPSNVTLELSTSKIHYGENITVTGSVPVGETNVTLTYANFDSGTNATTLNYSRTNSKTLNGTAKYVMPKSGNTSSSGVFRDVYYPNRTGTWIVWASWNGTETYFDAVSNYEKFTIKKMNMSISCNATRNVTIGDNVTIIGSITPAIANITVSLTFTSGNATVKKTALTDSNGTYIITWKPERMGLWRGYGNTAGNSSISAAYSNVTTFMVNDTFLNQYLIFIIGGAGGAAGVAVVFIIRKRRYE